MNQIVPKPTEFEGYNFAQHHNDALYADIEAIEFWDFLGGEGAYHDLLDCFERVGIELRPEIDQYFERFKN